MNRCGHWTVGDRAACAAPGAAQVTATDGEETWTGWLCAAHLAEYLDDPEMTVVVHS